MGKVVSENLSLRVSRCLFSRLSDYRIRRTVSVFAILVTRRVWSTPNPPVALTVCVSTCVPPPPYKNTFRHVQVLDAKVDEMVVEGMRNGARRVSVIFG